MYPSIGADYTHLGGLGDEKDDLDQVGGDDLLETGGCPRVEIFTGERVGVDT